MMDGGLHREVHRTFPEEGPGDAFNERVFGRSCGIDGKSECMEVLVLFQALEGCRCSCRQVHPRNSIFMRFGRNSITWGSVIEEPGHCPGVQVALSATWKTEGPPSLDIFHHPHG